MIVIRPEEARDIEGIYALTVMAFEGKAYSDGGEADVIDRLRDAGALTLSLVGEEAGEIVAHIGFSPVTGAADWYALGPVSVTPPLQRKGVGRTLIEEGLDRIRRLGAAGVVLEGSPEYYRRFGFAPSAALTYKGKPSPYLQTLVFRGEPMEGEIGFHGAFG